MPRAYDPSLVGQQLPVDHDPLSRIEYRTAKPDFDLDALMAQVSAFVEDYLFPVIKELTGIDLSIFLPLLHDLELDFSSPAAFIESLVDAIVGLPAALMSVVVGLVDTLLHEDGTEQLTELLGGLVSLLVSLPAILVDLGEALVSSGAGLLGIDSPLNAQNLYNQISSGLLGLIPVAQIGAASPNLLANPGFDTDESIADNPGWTWDGTDGHTTNGCASTTANGSLRSIVSNTIQVAQDQTMPIGAWVKYTGLTATAGQNAIRVNVVAYLGSALVATTMVASVLSPTGTSTSAPTDHGFVHLQGNYTVPAGVDTIVVQPQVTPAATAGTVKFDDAHASKSGLLAQNLVTNLTADLGNLFGQFTSLYNQFKGAVGGTLADVATRIQALSTAGDVNATRLFNTAPLAAIPTNLLTRSNITDLGSLMDNVTNALIGTGSLYSGTDTTQARGSLDSIFGDVLNTTEQLQSLRSNDAGANVSGISVSVSFSNSPDGALPSNFTTTYSGSGTSTLGVSDGKAGWRSQVNNGNRTGNVIYNVTPTSTDFQLVRGTLASPPPGGSSGGAPRIAAIGRVDNPANPQNYVWARGYCTGFLTYRGDIGCTVNGVETVWASNIALTWSMDIVMVIGVGTNARRYQVYSGTKLVYDYTEVGTVSMLGAGYRYWGCRTEIRTGSGGAVASPAIAGTSVSDNAPPDVVGSGAVISRRSSTAVAMAGGTHPFPNNFFGQIDAQSQDISINLTTGAFTVGYDGWYAICAGVLLNGALFEKSNMTVYRNGVFIRFGGAFDDGQISNQATWLLYLQAGDAVQAGYFRESGSNAVMVGDSTGTWTYHSIALLNRSYA